MTDGVASPSSATSFLARVVTGQLSSSLGMAFRRVIVALLLVRLTTEPLFIVAESAVGAAGALVLGLWGSVFIDRLGRRRLARWLPLVEGVLTLALAAAELVNATSIALIYVYTLLVSGAMTLREATLLSVLQGGVPRHQLARAYSLYSGTDHGIHILGKPVAGALFAFTAAGSLFLGAIFHAIAGAVFGSLRGNFEVPYTRQPVLEALREAQRWLTSHRGFRVVILQRIVVLGGAGAVLALLALHAKQVLQISDAAYGILAATMPLGGMVGVFSAPYGIRFAPVSTLLSGSTLVFGACLALLASTGSPVVTAVALFGCAASLMFGSGIVAPLLQAAVEPRLYGRLQTLVTVIAGVAAPSGALGAGAIAAQVDLGTAWWALAAAASVTAVVTFWPLRSLDELGKTLRRGS